MRSTLSITAIIFVLLLVPQEPRISAQPPKPDPDPKPPAAIDFQLGPTGDYKIIFKEKASFTAPPNCDLYFWTIPHQLTAKKTGNSVSLTGPDGEYTISVSAVSADWEKKKFVQHEASITFILGSTKPTPNPNPGPNPGPNPNPTPDPDETLGFISGSVAWTQTMNEGKQFKKEIADNFEAVAAAIAAGSIRSVNESQVELSKRNRQTIKGTTAIGEWTVFFQAWSKKATELNVKKKLRNVAGDYAIAYRETAAGLRK